MQKNWLLGLRGKLKQKTKNNKGDTYFLAFVALIVFFMAFWARVSLAAAFCDFMAFFIALMAFFMAAMFEVVAATSSWQDDGLIAQLHRAVSMESAAALADHDKGLVGLRLRK